MSLRKTLIRHEGLRLKPYKCSAGKLTIGVGRNIEDNGITEREAMLMLDHDIESVQLEAEKLPFWRSLSLVRQDIIVMMIFNMGLPKFLTFKKLIQALTRKDYIAAAFEMENSKWAAQVGYRAEELADMMRLNRYVK